MIAKEKEKTFKNFRPIPLNSLRTNTVTDFDIFIRISASDSKNSFVLYRNKSIDFLERTRENLVAQGIDTLYIDSSDSKTYQLYLENNLEAIIKDEDIPPAEKSRMAYRCATGLVEELLENPRSGEHVKRSKSIISNFVDYMLNDSHAFFTLLTETSFNYYTYTHSVNVAVFGIALAHKLARYEEHDIKTIGSGLILHDVGKGLIDQKILNKEEQLDNKEWAILRRHPERGAELLRAVGQVSEQSLIIVERHHEKLDGSGYPDGLAGDEIHEYARIAAIADIFDALTTQRPYRPALRSFPALEIMRDKMAGEIDLKLFREFVFLLGQQDRNS